MIPVKRAEQTDAEYLQEVDGLLNSLQGMVRSDGWKRLAKQLEAERDTAWLKMVNAQTTDSRAMHATEYMVLKRILDAPGHVMEQASQTMLARPEKKGPPNRR